MKEDNIVLNLAIPAIYPVDARKFAEGRLYREASDILMERLKNGERLALIPHNIRESVVRRGYGDEIVLNLEIEVYPIRDTTVYDTMGDKMRSLLEKDAYVRVPYGYSWNHIHRSKSNLPAFLEIRHPKEKISPSTESVILEPVYNDKGKELGRMGKCGGCGKVFYCLREEF